MSYPLSIVLSMESVDSADRGSPAVRASQTDLGELNDHELDDRLAVLGRERCRVEALLVEAVAEKRRRVGGRAAAATMRERLHVSARQATAEVELAASVASQFPATLAAWRAGEITSGHARVIAKVGADPEHADEPALLEMARGVPVDLFARMTRQYAAQTDSCVEHKRQHANRWASLVQDPDGSWRLSAYYDYDTGKRISLAFNQMVRTYRNGVASNGIDRTDRSTPEQRRADALANLITGEGPHNRSDTTLLSSPTTTPSHESCATCATTTACRSPPTGSPDSPRRQGSCLPSSAPTAIPCGWDEPHATPAPASASCSQPATAAASTAPLPQKEANPTTSNGSAGAATPTSTTSRCCANAVTTSYTTTDGNSAATTANSDCGHLHRSQHNPVPATTHAPSTPASRDPSETPSCEPDHCTPPLPAAIGQLLRGACSG